jgi:glyoxylase-like metal-dependent hydrolase (beta-lactamase superfamily II)
MNLGTPSKLIEMKVKMFTSGPFQTNCYVASCEEERKAIIIDPGFDGLEETESLAKFIVDNRLAPEFVVDTHGHPDHTCGNGIIKKRFGTPILIHKNDANMIGGQGKRIAEAFGFRNFSPSADGFLEEGKNVNFGQQSLEVIHTPGHSPGSITLLGKSEVFTGDTLFAASIGRTDFPESSEVDMQRSLERLKNLQDDLIVYPGHGSTTKLGAEKRSNPFLTGFL